MKFSKGLHQFSQSTNRGCYRGCHFIALTIIGVLAMANAQASSYMWRGNVIELFTTLESACQTDWERRRPDPQMGGCEYYLTYSRCEKTVISGTDPPTSVNDTATIKVFYYIHGIDEACGILSPEQEYPLKNLHGESVPDDYYISVDPETSSEPSSCSSEQKPVHVADPVNPANGGVYTTANDMATQGIAGSVSCSRFYNSLDTENHGLGVGWRRAYSRTIQANYSSVALRPYVASPKNSSLFADPAAACTNGFAEVKGQVSEWADAIASYNNGVCALTRGAINVGSISILSAGTSLPAPTASAVSFDITRDDGQIIRFSVINSVITAPPGTGLKLAQTSSGYTLTDGNNSLELYDTEGRLISVNSRSGVVQTMSYDASDRLIGVSDNFGHQLMFGYDAQNRLISVTRQ